MNNKDLMDETLPVGKQFYTGEPVEMVVYGEPGAQKTSFVLDPETGATLFFEYVIHIDFDGNSKFLKDSRTTIDFTKASLPSDVKPGYYHILATRTPANELAKSISSITSVFMQLSKTKSVCVVIDSATMLGNKAVQFALDTNQIKRSSDFVPNQNDWGIINGIQLRIFENIKLRGASYILICHRKGSYDTNGNLTALFPSIQGDQSRNSITGSCGTILHVEIVNGIRNITYRTMPGRRERVKFESKSPIGKIETFADLKPILE
jgi:hypothetical protein